jgi:hypothetical protein
MIYQYTAILKAQYAQREQYPNYPAELILRDRKVLELTAKRRNLVIHTWDDWNVAVLLDYLESATPERCFPKVIASQGLDTRHLPLAILRIYFAVNVTVPMFSAVTRRTLTGNDAMCPAVSVQHLESHGEDDRLYAMWPLQSGIAYHANNTTGGRAVVAVDMPIPLRELSRVKNLANLVANLRAYTHVGSAQSYHPILAAKLFKELT